MINLKEIYRDKNQLRLFSYDLIRFYLGVGLFLKGIQFMTQPKVLEFLDKDDTDQRFIKVIDILRCIFSYLWGLFLSIGIGTRIAAFMQIPVLIGAVIFVHSKEGLFTYSHNLEFTIFILFLLLIYIIAGAGKYSVDHFLKNEFRKTD